MRECIFNRYQIKITLSQFEHTLGISKSFMRYEQAIEGTKQEN